MSSLTLVAPAEGSISTEALRARIQDALSAERQPFSEELVKFCAAFGTSLFRGAPRGSQLHALGFFLREARLRELRSHFLQSQTEQVIYSPRGVVFQIPPTNVPTLTAYSWLFSALTGNVTIVRLPSSQTADSESLISFFSQTVRVFNADPTHTFFIRYGHDDEITAALSQLCDLRVIWGGDETVRRLRTFALAPGARDLTFPDRYSFAAVSASAWLKLAPAERDALIQAAYRDLYLFDQAACSSPQLMVWIGERESCQQASSDFYRTLAAYAEKRYQCELGAVVAKKAFACAAVLDQNARSHTAYSNDLTVVSVESPQNLTREHCGGGFLFDYFTDRLDSLETFITRRDQTMTYFGFDAAELRSFVSRVASHGLDRVVPIGQALSFAHIWDGYDLIQEFLRRTHLITADSGEQSSAAA